MSQKLWFAFWQKGLPKSHIKACGPFEALKEAEHERNAEAQNWDCNVSPVYPAESEEEAEEKAKLFWP